MLGKLIAFEGPDGAGKTTQIEALRKYLNERGCEVVLTTNNSSAFLREPIRRMKDKLSQGDPIDLVTNVLLNATDLSDRLHNLIRPAMNRGCLVLADRYVLSYIAHTIVRGADRNWIEAVFSFAMPPDLAFLINTPVELCLERRKMRGTALGSWEAGLGLGLSEDVEKSFLEYQSKCHLESGQLARKRGFVILDGSASADELQRQIRTKICTLLKSDLSADNP